MGWKKTRQWFFFLLVSTSAAAGVGMMTTILMANSLTALEIVLLVLFAISFSWIACAFWSAMIGFALQLLRRDPLSLKPQLQTPLCTDKPHARTAVVMPVYNEDTDRIMAGFETCLRALASSGHMDKFDFYMLSDTRKPELAQAELAAWAAMQKRLGKLAGHAFYRRREKNTHRKVGNLADFCQRWGHAYEHMIVLDADSIMSAQSMLTLVHAMEKNPRAGLIQTVPIPVRQTTLFGRFLQFASILYCPMLATGLAFWQTDSGNYWGHNAIIRLSAFMRHCGLPTLEGPAPFGGDILSHDFVEAALLSRAGWEVYLLADLPGSYEEVPSNILDYATRDRRWVQGNIQHLGLLGSTGLCMTSRVHFFMGALAYISSLIWLLMLLLSTADALILATSENTFFDRQYQLFPNWQVAETGLIHALLLVTAGLLMLPKLFAVILAMMYRREEFGGAWRLGFGALVEALFAVMIAPLMMVYHAFFVLSVFLGYQVSWNAQAREGRMVPWSDSLRRSAPASLIALLWGTITYLFTPVLFWWMMPVLLGLVLAAPIIRFSSSLTLGRWARRLGIFVSPSEHREPEVLRALRIRLANMPAHQDQEALAPPLPAEHWQEMPIQRFDQGPLPSGLPSLSN
ncbi:glucans biosynthesis glucosyltransferase MdoH [Bowmanella dokdonensis]|uniref:Glucans biosynthesis glucosyltransferase H n=1 Tax=Bowmanella dokdonensis TaxID=751969 RepID=A0A939IR35_9ALTE|nr:glucans biosynthesis glucosyltransferase MdoH [Bowmanella dokdonensis]